MSKFKQKIIFSTVLISLTGLLLFAPIGAKRADAIFGVGDISFTTITVDIPRVLYQIGEKVAKVFFRQFRNRMVKQLQNDLVNWVQGEGKPKFMTSKAKFWEDSVKNSMAIALDEVLGAKENGGIDVCSPFKASLKVLVSRPAIQPLQEARCTLGDMKDNLKQFERSFSQGGGWKTWIRLHETNNTLPGSYLAATRIIGSKIDKTENTVQAQIGGNGFLDQEECKKISVQKYKIIEGLGGAVLDTDTYVRLMNSMGNSGDQVNLSLVTNASGQPYANAQGKFLDYFEPVGTERMNISFDPPMDMGKVNSNHIFAAECIDKKTVTPGSIVSDQISGALKSTGIDKLINAQDIGQILDAVIDAAVNRVAREGLSHMKAGSGSYTKPYTGARSSSSGSRSTQQKEAQGLEGIAAADTLTRVVGLKSNLDKLVGSYGDIKPGWDNPDLFSWSGIGSMTTDPFLGKVANFNTALMVLRSYANDRTCGKAASNSQQKIQRCLFDMDYGTDLNVETNLPGPFVSNALIARETATVWKAIESKANAALTAHTGQCYQSISLTLNPRRQEDLPISNGSGITANWTGEEHSYDHYLASTDHYAGFVWEAYNDNTTVLLNSFIAQAESQIAKKETEFESYRGVIDNIVATKDSFDSDYEFAQSVSPGIILYTNLLMSYDRAGRNITIDDKTTSLTTLATKYSDALASKQEAKIKEAKSKFVKAKIETERLWEESLKSDSEKLLLVQSARSKIEDSRMSMPLYVTIVNDSGESVSTPTDDIIKGQKVIINPGEIIPFDSFVVEGTSRMDKSKVTEQAKDNNFGVRPGSVLSPGYVNKTEADGGAKITIEVTGFADEFLDTGISPSEALSQVMEETINTKTEKPYFPFSIEQLRNELELRESKVSKMQNELTNKVGNFISKDDIDGMANAGIDMGETEWEYYYYNRAQYASVGLFYNWLEIWPFCRVP